jgi:hypothetical protein
VNRMGKEIAIQNEPLGVGFLNAFCNRNTYMSDRCKDLMMKSLNIFQDPYVSVLHVSLYKLENCTSRMTGKSEVFNPHSSKHFHKYGIIP